ncbi:MAG TPA: alkaline phosphatase family protein [Mycobacteriales bacterium]|nr:alkaline phosphatase family protein [Mycobacteriales bacterium]
MRDVVGATVAALALLVTGCGSASTPRAEPAVTGVSPTTSGAPVPTTRVLATSATQTSAPCGRGGSAAGNTHVIWIWMENRSYSQVLGPSGQAPHLAWYARHCAVATNYYAITHPSLPNYLAAVSGSTGGVTTDCSPSSCPQWRTTIFRQLSARGRQWRSFAENMQTACDRASYDGYAARHNPAVYFPGIRDQCLNWDRPMGGATGRFATMLQQRTLRPFTFITPNLCDDGHDCSTATADSWLGTWLNRIVASPMYAAGHTAVFVTWDEGLDGSTNRVATVLIAPSVTPGTRSSTHYTHYSLLRTTEELLGLPLLRAAANAHSMRSML